MSIRKRLIFSNIAMVLIPVFLFVIAAALLFSIFFGSDNGPWTNNESQEFSELKKVASLTPENFLDKKYLEEVPSTMVVIKNNDLIYESANLDQVKVQDLAQQGFRPVHWIDGNLYNIQSYDFYFTNGDMGTFYLLSDAGSLANFGRIFFPIMFGVLLLILILTNGLLSYFVSKSIIQPINKLMVAAKKIGQGNLDFKIEGNTKDELGKLALSFDQMRQKLKDSTELQLQYEENRKELISNISHDLKTPITSIKGYVEGIRDGVANTPEKMERYLQTIYTKSVDMDKLIDELALYSKLDLNRVPFDFEKVDMKAFMKELIDEVEFDVENKGIELTINTEEIGKCQAIIDREKIKRVITNIISNSIKYMDKEEKTVEIQLKNLKEKIMVQIKDNGPGIPKEALPFVFERFYRADPSRNSRTGGSGLGLAIAKHIIEEHGGEIWAESVPEEGTSVFFTLKNPEVFKGEENINN